MGERGLAKRDYIITEHVGLVGVREPHPSMTTIGEQAGHIEERRPYRSTRAMSKNADHIRANEPYRSMPTMSPFLERGSALYSRSASSTYSTMQQQWSTTAVQRSRRSQEGLRTHNACANHSQQNLPYISRLQVCSKKKKNLTHTKSNINNTLDNRFQVNRQSIGSYSNRRPTVACDRYRLALFEAYGGQQ